MLEHNTKVCKYLWSGRTEPKGGNTTLCGTGRRNTDSLSHRRKAEVGRDLCRLPSPCPCSEQGCTQQVAQGCAQLSFECVQGWRLHNLYGQPVPVSINLEVKKDFLNRILYTGKILSCSLSQRTSELPSGHHQISEVVAVPTAVPQKDIRVRDTQNFSEVSCWWSLWHR